MQKLKKGLFLISGLLISVILNFLWILNDGVDINNEFLFAIINSKAFILNWIPYFMLGIIYANYYEELKLIMIKYKSFLVIVIFILFLDILISIDLNVLYTSTNISNLIYIPFFLVFLNYFHDFVTRDNICNRIFTFLGNYSMGVYLTHPLIIKVLRFIGLTQSINSSNMFVFTLILTIALSVLLTFLISLLPYGSYIVPIPQKQKMKILKTNIDNQKVK
nr:acyltransferase family protein [Exiguobacterium oxidotolerans]